MEAGKLLRLSCSPARPHWFVAQPALSLATARFTEHPKPDARPFKSFPVIRREDAQIARAPRPPNRGLLHSLSCRSPAEPSTPDNVVAGSRGAHNRRPAPERTIPALAAVADWSTVYRHPPSEIIGPRRSLADPARQAILSRGAGYGGQESPKRPIHRSDQKIASSPPNRPSVRQAMLHRDQVVNSTAAKLTTAPRSFPMCR